MVLPITNATKSFWIEGADSPLRSHRTTEDLPETADVVIIGSGYSGATAAYWLNKFSGEDKPKIVLLEARDLCGGATGRNGGQLRPHLYSRYTPWSKRFGPKVAMDLIEHENAHLSAFERLFKEEGIAEKVCFKLGQTFDAAMTDEAEERLSENLERMKRDHGEDHHIVKSCRYVKGKDKAEEITQMKGAQAAFVHPSGQVWPYKFVHALLEIVEKQGNLNIQTHTPATAVSSQDAQGNITVSTDRGDIQTKAVFHATNRWASHLLKEFQDLIIPGRGTLAAIKAPEGFLKHTGAQHWDAIVNNYHLQLPPPHNHIIVGGAKPLTVHNPKSFVGSDLEDQQFEGVPDFYAAWPELDIVGWKGGYPAEFAKERDEGGVWSGVYGNSVDGFPFIGPVPNKPGHFLSAGFTGHGMPRILLSVADLVPKVLDHLNIKHTTPEMLKDVPSLPAPFILDEARLDKLKTSHNLEAYLKADIDAALSSSYKSFVKPKPKGLEETLEALAISATA